MTTLTLLLPLVAPGVGTEFDYVVSSNANAMMGHGTAPLALLPRADTLVLVVPARALSWHQVRLPPVAASRLHAALQGLLEERVLDEVGNVAFALGPRRTAAGDALVAVFDKVWMRSVLEFFEQAKRPAARVVPEFDPGALEAGQVRLQVTGTANDATLTVVQAQGLTCLPLETAPAAFAGKSALAEAGDVLAEPAVAELAEQALGRAVVVQPAAQRLLLSGQGEWELAQFDLAISGSGRVARRWGQHAKQFLHAPAWRAARWGLIGLLLANLVGLNAWAWKQEALVRAKQDRVRSLLVQTFPGVKAVVDAPLQMERQLALLRQAGGGLGKGDMEAMLAGVGAALPPGSYASAVTYGPGEVALKGVRLAGPQFGELRARLGAQGYEALLDGEQLVVRAEGRP